VTAAWQTRLAASASRLGAWGAAILAVVSRPAVFQRLRLFLGGILCLWILASLWRAAWSFFPEAAELPPAELINPMSNSAAQASRPQIAIDALVQAHLFGAPGEQLAADVLAEAGGRGPAMNEVEAESALAGIEDGAPVTRLPLQLRGVVAASRAGLGQAVIEHRNQQELFQVGDDLPVPGEVVLAKVLPDRVVLDNGGRYELLRLFEDGDLKRQPVSTGARARPVSSPDIAAAAPLQDPRREAPTERERLQTPREASAVAARYRDRLYDNPESLVDVVRVSAVREGDALLGYRIAPGKSAAEFAALGFRAGDLVTAINGLSLSDPANTMRLYQAMRSASSASFELERDGQSMTLDVDLSADGSRGGP
jgi:general secretion pathway protein C